MYVLSLILTLLIVILTRFLYKRLVRKWRNEPPGPWGVPILGYSIFVKPRIFRAFMKIKSKYPDIAQVNFGQKTMIILSSYQTIKEALLTKGDNFSGRIKLPLFEFLGLVSGIINSDGALWKEHRRFALKTLRDFGFGKNKSEEIIQTEIQYLLGILENKTRGGNHHINIMNLLLRSVSNVICTLSMGEQPGYENEELSNQIDDIREMLSQSSYTFPPNMFPTLFKLVTPLFLALPRIQRVANVLLGNMNFFKRKIEEHEKEFDPSQENRDYIEAFLLEKQKQDLANPGNTSYTSKELQRIMFDLFVAGTDTTSNSLAWGFLYLAMHLDVQRRCHEEIDATIGREKQPIMRDKEQMPYIQAVLDEIQRFSSVVPMGLLHRNFHSDTIHGYHIPEDTVIVPFIYGVHHDPSVWERPEQFYPEHFLTTFVDGKLKYSPREQLIPFSIGRRECLGESLAKMDFFLFFVSILQKYEVHLPENIEDKLPDILLGSEGVIHSPGPHEIVFHSRL
jgi:cytochrome P450 family 2 subfamily J